MNIITEDNISIKKTQILGKKVEGVSVSNTDQRPIIRNRLTITELDRPTSVELVTAEEVFSLGPLSFCV